jgi:hypothetical protein
VDVKPAAIELRIDELVLHGFAPHDRARIGRAVEVELARLLAEAAAPGRALPPSLAANGAVLAAEGGVVHVAPAATPERVGGQVAGAVYRALVAPRSGGHKP